MVNLRGLDLKELKLLRKKVDTAIQKIETNNHAKARAEVVKVANKYGIPVETLIADRAVEKSNGRKALKRGKKVPPKYRHPEDMTLTWTGRGLKPKWIALMLENGAKLEDLLIK